MAYRLLEAADVRNSAHEAQPLEVAHVVMRRSLPGALVLARDRTKRYSGDVCRSVNELLALLAAKNGCARIS